MKIAILSIRILTISSSYGFDCYNCLFHIGTPPDEYTPSDPDCEKNPKTIVNCGLGNSVSGLNQTSNGNVKANVQVCSTSIGRGSGSGVLVIQRACWRIDEMYADKCEEGYNEGDQLIWETCTCTTDKCNGKSAGKDETSGQSVVSGTGFILISAFALIVAIISK